MTEGLLGLIHGVGKFVGNTIALVFIVITVPLWLPLVIAYGLIYAIRYLGWMCRGLVGNGYSIKYGLEKSVDVYFRHVKIVDINMVDHSDMWSRYCVSPAITDRAIYLSRSNAIRAVISAHKSWRASQAS